MPPVGQEEVICPEQQDSHMPVTPLLSYLSGRSRSHVNMLRAPHYLQDLGFLLFTRLSTRHLDLALKNDGEKLPLFPHRCLKIPSAQGRKEDNVHTPPGDLVTEEWEVHLRCPEA